MTEALDKSSELHDGSRQFSEPGFDPPEYEEGNGRREPEILKPSKCSFLRHYVP